MKEVRIPTVEECLYLHEQLLERFGGAPGVIDLGLLESALARPRSGYYTTLSEQAAALLHSLVMNHCFVDGNKRVAFATTAIFLLMQGYALSVTPSEGEKFILRIASGQLRDIAPIVSWLERHMKEVIT